MIVTALEQNSNKETKTKVRSILSCRTTHILTHYFQIYLLPPAYIVRREVTVSQVSICSFNSGGGGTCLGQRGYLPWLGGTYLHCGVPTLAGGGGEEYTPWLGWATPSKDLLHGRRYASCVHAGGLSCCYVYLHNYIHTDYIDYVKTQLRFSVNCNGVFTLSDTENDISSETDEMAKISQWHQWQDLAKCELPNNPNYRNLLVVKDKFLR